MEKNYFKVSRLQEGKTLISPPGLLLYRYLSPVVGYVDHISARFGDYAENENY
jgi:hypothetical protein